MTKKKVVPKIEVYPNAVVITNDFQPVKQEFIELLYQGALNGQLGYMDGMDPDTGNVVPLLVGLEASPDNPDEKYCYPLARIFLDTASIKKYLVPDGNGNYHRLSASISDPAPQE